MSGPIKITPVPANSSLPPSPARVVVPEDHSLDFDLFGNPAETGTIGKKKPVVRPKYTDTNLAEKYKKEYRLSPSMMAAWAKAYGIGYSPKLKMALLDESKTYSKIPVKVPDQEIRTPEIAARVEALKTLVKKLIKIETGKSKQTQLIGPVLEGATNLLKELGVDLDVTNEPHSMLQSVKALSKWMTREEYALCLVVVLKKYPYLKTKLL